MGVGGEGEGGADGVGGAAGYKDGSRGGHVCGEGEVFVFVGVGWGEEEGGRGSGQVRGRRGVSCGRRVKE